MGIIVWVRVREHEWPLLLRAWRLSGVLRPRRHVRIDPRWRVRAEGESVRELLDRMAASREAAAVALRTRREQPAALRSRAGTTRILGRRAVFERPSVPALLEDVAE